VSRITLNGTFADSIYFQTRTHISRLVNENEQPVYLVYDVVGPYKRYYGSYGASVKVYDVSDRNYPILVRNVSVNGTYLRPRMIGIMYTPSQPSRCNVIRLTALVDNGRVDGIEASSIYHQCLGLFLPFDDHLN
jgi:hypothetical protein